MQVRTGALINSDSRHVSLRFDNRGRRVETPSKSDTGEAGFSDSQSSNTVG